MTQSYSAWGLEIRSELALELPAGVAQEPNPIEVRFGGIEARGTGQPGYSIQRCGTLLTIPEVGRYLIRNGREIVVDPDPNACPHSLRLFLLGSAFGALLHQRGLMPLHANAVMIDGRAIAFTGHSGAGKSTLAAWFHDRGFPVLADDVCVIGAGADDRPQAYPGLPRVRLWREALETFGRSSDDFSRSYASADKYDVPVGCKILGPTPLAAVYLLQRRSEKRGGVAIERLRGVEAVDALVSNTYRGGYLRMIGQVGPHLRSCVELARRVPVFRAKRSWGFDRFDEHAALLEAHARKEAVGA